MKKHLTYAVILLTALKAYSQLQTSGLIFGGNAYRFGETQIGGLLGSTDIRGIGIGNFSALGAGAIPQSRLHVNNFFFP